MQCNKLRQNRIARSFALLSIATCSLFFSSCSLFSHNQDTPSDTKHLEKFHLVNFEQQDRPLAENSLNLYVDYSTCCALGQNSQFFQDIAASLVSKTTAYYSIKGATIAKETGDVYTLLRNINEVNYAELAKAANQMANVDEESVLLTDGEYYTPSIAKGHDNDPYLAGAFKTWILKGHDVYIISEPYLEPNNGQAYHKKRFYILFTDDRLPNNIHQRIARTVDLTKYPDVDEFHIAASHPQLKGNGNNCSTQNEILQSKSKGYGSFEIEDWDGCDWKTIEDNLVNAVDENTGQPLPSGLPIIQMGLDKNSFGCYRINELGIKVYDINQEYYNFYTSLENGEKVAPEKYELTELENFMQIDKKEFDKHSKINIGFNPDWFDPSVLTGKPYNYFKIDITVQNVQEIFSSHEDKFTFESICQPGSTNVSVASSIKQCLADADVINKMLGQTIYTIYVKSEQK
jgi:hypothetical protein